MAGEPKKSSTEAAGRLGFLDGVRGLAALWVVIGHSMMYGGWYWSKFPKPLIAVDVFMFVSGYLMIHHWNRRVGDRAGRFWEFAGEFWIRRFFRIAPIYYVCLVLMFAQWEPLRAGLEALQAAYPEQWAATPEYHPANWDSGASNFLARLTFLFGFVPSYSVASYTGDWSLSLEMQFYALLPFAVVWLRRWGPGPVAWISVLVALAVREASLRLQGHLPEVMLIHPLPAILPLKMPVFLVGMLIADRHHDLLHDPRRTLLDMVLALFVASLSSRYVVGVAALSFFLVLDGSALSPGARRWQGRLSALLDNRLMTFLADASYSVYLFHMPILFGFGGWLLTQPWFQAMPGRTRVIVLLSAVLVATYPIAYLLHWTVERPGIEWGRRLAKSWRNRRSAS